MCPLISIISSAIRTEYWLKLYSSLTDNDTPFEIIFTGDRRPNFPLPNNFKFIYTTVKPVQCVEIAFREAQGEFILNLPDDITLLSNKVLDKLLQEYKTLSDKSILSCVYCLPNRDSTEMHRFEERDSSSPVMPVGGFLNRKLWNEIGGIDRRFIGLYWDLDMAMRLYEMGGNVVLSSNVFITENNPHSSLYKRVGANHDRILLDNLWLEKGKITQRKDKTENFIENNILIESQGPKGEWQ